MADEYWLIMESPRWNRFSIQPSFLPRWLFFRLTFFRKVCEYGTVRNYVDKMEGQHPNYSFWIGVTRGNDIHIIHRVRG